MIRHTKFLLLALFLLGSVPCLFSQDKDIPNGISSRQWSKFTEKYDEVRRMEQYLIVVKDGRTGLFDTLLNEVLPVKYRELGYLLDNLFTVRDEQGWWLVTKGGKILSKKAYKDMLLGKFSKEEQYFIAVSDGVKWGLIDEDGSSITPLRLDNVELPVFSFGYPSITLDGESYMMVSPFVEGLSVLLKTEWIENTEEHGPSLRQVYHYGFMDENCRMVIPCEYDDADPFKNGRAMVSKSGKYFTIDKTGKVVE